MPSTSQNPVHENPTLLEVLSRLSAGEISLDAAALMLETDPDDLIQLIESSPDLVEQADTLANERRLDPKRTIERSHAGLASAVEHLSTRIQTDGHDMAVSELVAASKVLESLIGFAKTRENEIKAGNEKDGAKYPLLIQDTRQGGLRLYAIPPTSPMWVNTQLPGYQKPLFDWLETFAPISPDGKILSLKELLAGHVRVMTDTGLVLGGG